MRRHYDQLTDREQRLARMLFFTLWPNKGGFTSFEAGLEHQQYVTLESSKYV